MFQPPKLTPSIRFTNPSAFWAAAQFPQKRVDRLMANVAKYRFKGFMKPPECR
jgi:hypothetical protein